MSVQGSAAFTEGMGNGVPLEEAQADHLTHPLALHWPNS